MSLRLEAAMGIFLAIMAGGGANAGPDGKDVPRVAFLGFEFINTSLEATAPVEVERIRVLDDVLRQKLTASRRFEIVDVSAGHDQGDRIGTPHQQLQRLPAQVRAEGRRELGRVGHRAEGEQSNPEH
jgi:hypothetical protein